MNDFISYKKFADIASAEEFGEELSKNGIEYLLEDNNHSYLKIYGYTQIDIAYGINIKGVDFPKADKIIERYYANQVENIDESYYIFELTDNELREIISKPYEWGPLDYQIAKYVLNKRGLKVDDEEIDSMKTENINELSHEQKASNFKILCGYLLAFTFPIASILIGITIKYNRKILPTGEFFYINTKQDRKHGQIIILISIVCLCLFFLYFFYSKN